MEERGQAAGLGVLGGFMGGKQERGDSSGLVLSCLLPENFAILLVTVLKLVPLHSYH